MSKKKMNLLTTYSEILKQGNLFADEEGFIYSRMAGEPTPANVALSEGNGETIKRLVLPTANQLRAEGGWDKRIGFHPLKEGVLNSEPKTCEYLRKAINYRFNQVIQALLDQIMVYASDPNNQTNLKSGSVELLKQAADVDATMSTNIQKVLKKVNVTDTQNGFCSIYLKKMGKIKGEKFACIASVTFPFYEKLIEADKDDLGVKVRKKDIATLRKIIEHIIPKIDVEGEYNVGVTNSIAPFTEALVRATDKLGTTLNKTCDILFKTSKHLSKEDRDTLHEYLSFTSDHMATIDDLESLLPEINLIPNLPGNDGGTDKRQPITKEEQVNKPIQQWDTLTPDNVPNAQQQFTPPSLPPHPTHARVNNNTTPPWETPKQHTANVTPDGELSIKDKVMGYYGVRGGAVLPNARHNLSRQGRLASGITRSPYPQTQYNPFNRGDI